MALQHQQKEQFQELFNTLVNKSWADPEFKAELIRNPAATIEEITGRPVNTSSGKSIVVVDQSEPDVVYLNIPAKPDFENAELSDEELELVAGGEGSPVHDAGKDFANWLEDCWESVFG